ncbi:MAG: hypothetical protein ABIH38_03030 [Patescibacteria group bacterium]
MKFLKIIPKIFLVIAFIFAGLLVIQPEKAFNQASSSFYLSQSGLTALLSPSLLDNQVKDKTDWFTNIIPVANAAIPFDALNNRKLTLYAGVASVINGDASDTYVLEMGKFFKPVKFPWIANGLGLYSSGSLILGSKTSASENFIQLDSNTGTTYFPGQIYTGMQGAGRYGDLHIYREGVCNSNGCRALVNLNSNGLLTLNYNNDFSHGVYTPGKFYVGFTPDSLTAENFDSLMVKNTSAGSAIYAENSSTGYAGNFSGKVSASQYCIAGANCISSWPSGSGGVVSNGAVNWVTKFSPDGNTLANSIIYETGSKIGIGQNSPTAKFVVNNPTTALKVGSSGDAIYAYANSDNAALVGEQGGEGYGGYFSTKGDREPLADPAKYSSAVRAILDVDTGSAKQATGYAVRAEVYNSPIDNPGPFYAGYFKCGGPSDLENYLDTGNCWAGYFYGEVKIEIPKQYVNNGSTTGLRISNSEYTQPIGLDVQVANSRWTFNGPIYGINIATGDHDNSGGSNIINYGIYSDVGNAVHISGAGTSYALYAKANLSNSKFAGQTNAYAGYFEGNVAVQGVPMVKNSDATQTAWSTFVVEKSGAISCAVVCTGFTTPLSPTPTYTTAKCLAQFDANGASVGCANTTLANKCLCYFDTTP